MGLRSRLLFWGGIAALLMAIPLFQPPVDSVDALEGPQRHLVKNGETLSSIALVYGVPIDDLMSINALSDPNRISEGAALKLPVGAGASGQREYIVKPGDSLASLSIKLSSTISAIADANHLDDPNRLRVGQRLIIPEGAAGPPTPQPTAASRATATAVPTTPKGAQAAVEQVIQNQAPQGARVGIVAINLATGERVEHRANESFPSASVNKLAVLTEAQRQIESGALTLTDPIRGDLRNMIVLSDNQAANRLIDLLGSVKINNTMLNLGFRSTVLRNHFEGTALPGFNGQLNATSPSDMATLMSKMTAEQLVSPLSSRAIRDLLLSTREASRIPRLLPAEARVAHKAGWYQNVSNDVGVIYSPRSRFVLAVFSTGAADREAANQFIAAVAQTLYKLWG